ncbi:MAG: GNAT family N-acetyltransferase [Candidatus Bathyarchaeota archaeon]|nr:GNAT family N-acetyltransferase [Candidatus Bathyarchaeota archaeon]
MLEGKNVNLRRAEKEDVSLVAQWWSSSEYMGEYQDVLKISQAELEKVMLEDTVFFIIEKKDEAKIGHITAWMRGRMMEIGFALVLGERGKGYGTEVIQLMVDYLFLKKDVVRIQTSTNTQNVASQRALEKAGFLKEGTMRKSWYAKGNYRDHHLYSILREEWKEPKILTKQH